MDLNLQSLNDVLRTFGRGVVFYASRWDPYLGNALDLAHLGDTEGNITLTPNASMEALTTPELTGPAPHEVDFMGEAPTLEVPLYLADPALASVLSPIGAAGGGLTMRRGVTEYTLVVFPEALFIDAVAGVNTRLQLSVSAGVWTLNGSALDAAHAELLAASLWLWRGHFSRPPRTFHGGGGDASKNLETVTFQVMVHPDMPEEHNLYTLGDPNTQGIDTDGGS